MAQNTSGGAAIASNYIIELDDDGEKAFVICQTTLVVSGDETWGGLTTADIAGYIERSRLRAAPLPGRPLHPSEFRAGPGHR